jgi:LacI family transcriptional regulator
VERAKRATVRDVARKAGVSVGTVSRVLNANPEVKPALRRRVEAALRSLAYRPQAAVRNLSRNASPVFSFVLSNRDLLHPFHSRILEGVSRQCEEDGYFVLFSTFRYSPDAPVDRMEVPMVLQAHGIADCLILAGTNYPNLLAALDGMGIPYVLLGNNLVSAKPRPPFDQVRFDDTQAASEAARYLIELGHRDIWFIGNVSWPWYRNRYEGYLQAMREAGLQPRGQTSDLSDDRFVNGELSAEMIVSQRHPLTAILAGTDDIAYGAWDALDRMGIKVPDQVSLIGFHDQPEPHRKRDLTTVRVEAEDIGRELARMAVAKARSANQPIPEIVVPSRLARRNSCRLLLPPVRASENEITSGIGE